jgi:hypothetical protein
MTMNRNHTDDRSRREIGNRWNQVRKAGEKPNQPPERVKGAELERRAPPLGATGYNSTTFGSWFDSHSFTPVFTRDAAVNFGSRDPSPGGDT